MTSKLRSLTLALVLCASPTVAWAQDTSTTENDAITTETESDGAAGNEVQGPESTDTDASGTENDAITTETESDGAAGNEVQGDDATGATDAEATDTAATDAATTDADATDATDVGDTEATDTAVAGTEAGTGTTNDAVTTTSESDGVQGNERQGGFPWGLLGLLGLLGLTGRRTAAVQQRTEVKLGGPTDGPRPS